MAAWQKINKVDIEIAGQNRLGASYRLVLPRSENSFNADYNPSRARCESAK